MQYSLRKRADTVVPTHNKVRCLPGGYSAGVWVRSAKTPLAAETIFSTSARPWAAERKAASNWEHGR